jgi:cellulose biosynthesis protein BcsQ
MLVQESFVFASNRGGVGKSTLVAQLSTAFALKHPDVKVLVLDLTNTANTTSMLLRHQDALSIRERCEAGELRVRTFDMLEGLQRFAVEKASWWRALTRLWSSTEAFDFSKHALAVHEHIPWSPPNLFLTVGGPETRRALAFDNWNDMVQAWHRTSGSTGSEDSWVIFCDTDATVEKPLAQFGLRVCRKLVVPITLSELDFERLFVEDELEPGLFPVLRMLGEEAAAQRSEVPPAKLHQIIFNRVQKRENRESEEHGIHLPFTPTRDDHALMATLASRLLDWVETSEEVAHQLFYRLEEYTHGGVFKARYLTAFQNGASNPFNTSQREAVPFMSLVDHEARDTATVVLPNGERANFSWAVLRALQSNIEKVLSKLCDEN